jgi:NACHT domain
VPRLQSLPISKLSWENFERLCLRLARLDTELETCRVYGTPGQTQEGIDVYAVERTSGKPRVLQCKRVKRFGPSNLSAAVDFFLNGTWASTATRFTFCTTFRLESTKLTTEIEKQRERLRAAGIQFEVWDAAELDVLLKDQSEIVDDFFGRPWVQLFCPPEGLGRLQNRVTGPTVAEMRAKLGVLYTRVFVAHDPGLPVELGSKASVPLRDRYVLPDVYENRVDSRTSSAEPPQSATSQAHLGQSPNSPNPSVQPASQTIDLPRQRRRLNDWLSEQACQVLLGGPGLGKSALLRYVTLDLLSQNPVLTQASSFHDTYLPIWLSFPFWTAKVDQSTAALSIPDIIQAWLHLWSEDRLWPLFEKALNDERLLLMVDGLDEYRSEDSARNALAQLQVFAEQRNCRVIATARPAGYDRLGVQRTGWPATYLAELTLAQQEQYALRWFAHQRQFLGETGEQEGQDRPVELAVASFMAEIGSSADLSELAKTPLLLGLLLYLKSSSIPLPNSRYRAYGRLVEHLISVHPIARRRAAMVKAEDSDLTPEDARTVFANLAFHLQSQLPEGLIERREAEDVISQFLRDDKLGFGLAQAEARRQARTLLAFGEQSLGLLVERGPQELGFLHRSFQEYLAAEHIARRPFAAQSDFVKQHCTEPIWQEVLLSLLHLTKRPEEVGELVAVISDAASLVSDRFITLPILCEVAVGDFQCPATLARKVCRDIIAEIEESPWLRHRERLLRSLLIGLFSPRVRDLIQERLRTWVPGRPWRHPVVLPLTRGSHSDDVVNCLLRLIIDEDDSINAQAATALANLAAARPEIADRLIVFLGRAYPVQTQVAALEALLTGWPDRKEWPRILSEIENSPGLEIRMIAIRRKIKIGAQTTADRDQVLSWARRGVGLRLLYGGSFTGVLLAGWPGDDVVKKKALEAVRPKSWDDQHMDQEIAFAILVQGFTDDQDAREAIASLIKEQHRDYLWMQHGPWVYERLKGIPLIIDAVDEWLTKHDAVLTREVSYFARIGWTQIGKQRLLEGLAQSFPF